MSEDIKEWAHMWGAKVRIARKIFFILLFQTNGFFCLGEIKK
jgi:hypothetical protein